MVDSDKAVTGTAKGNTMSEGAYAKAQVQQRTLIGSSPRSGFLQRACTCDQHTSVTQENVPAFNSIFDSTSRFGHDFSRIPIHAPAAGAIQAKLAINKPGDEYEQEVDRISEQMVHMPEPQLQRACACGGSCSTCQEESQDHEHERLQTKRVGASDSRQTAVPSIVREVLRSPGQPLDRETRGFMEPRFGHDFSRVRVHTGAAAGQSAQGVNAHAYTVGHDIVFGVGRFAPETQEGRRLLAHELTHVVQQRQQPVPLMIHRQLASSSGAAPGTYPVGLKVPAAPDAITGIHDWTSAYGTKGIADTHNAFDVDTFIMQQICIIDDTGAQRVYVYYTYNRADEDEKYAVGPDSVWSFVAQHGGRITAHARNTDQLPSREPQLDPRKLPAAPDAFTEEPTLYYTAPDLPRYDVKAPAFGIGKYSMTGYLRRMPGGSLAVLYYVAENVLSRFRKEYVVGPQWLGIFTEKIGGFMLIAEISYPLEPGAVPSGYQAQTGRYLAGLIHGDPKRARAGLEAWISALKDPGWWLQVILGYASAAVPEPPVRTPNLEIIPGGGERIPVPGAGAEPMPTTTVTPRASGSGESRAASCHESRSRSGARVRAEATPGWVAHKPQSRARHAARQSAVSSCRRGDNRRALESWRLPCSRSRPRGGGIPPTRLHGRRDRAEVWPLSLPFGLRQNLQRNPPGVPRHRPTRDSC